MVLQGTARQLLLLLLRVIDIKYMSLRAKHPLYMCHILLCSAVQNVPYQQDIFRPLTCPESMDGEDVVKN